MKKTISVVIILISSLIGYSQKDTTKSNIQLATTDTTYNLVGKMPDFQLLYASIVSPDDVSINQRKYLVAWLQKIQMIPPKRK